MKGKGRDVWVSTDEGKGRGRVGRERKGILREGRREGGIDSWVLWREGEGLREGGMKVEGGLWWRW